jgi:mercuric ion binding protein
MKATGLLARRLPARAAALSLAATLVVLLAGTSPSLATDGKGPAREAVVQVKGLACPFCVYGLEKRLRKLPGVERVHVELGKGEADIAFAPGSAVADAEIQKAVRDAGFTPGTIRWKEGGKS